MRSVMLFIPSQLIQATHAGVKLLVQIISYGFLEGMFSKLVS